MTNGEFMDAMLDNLEERAGVPTLTVRLSEIEAILSEIERLDAATGGKFRQVEDREAYDIAARIVRKMASKRKASA